MGDLIMPETYTAEDIKKAREEGLAQGQISTKLDLLLSANNDMRKDIAQVFERLAPIQVDVGRALEGLNRMQADHLELKGRTRQIEDHYVKQDAVESLTKRLDAVETQTATFEGRATLITIIVGAVMALMGGIIGFGLQQLLVFVR